MCVILIVANPMLHAKLKDVELDVHFLCEKSDARRTFDQPFTSTRIYL